MSELCIHKILEYFRSRTGIVFDRKLSIIKNKIAKFAASKGVKGCGSLLRAIKNDKELMQSFIDYMTVSTTYFYREKRELHSLAELASKLEARKILSLPCASGEESYSISIELFRKGLREFKVIGIDINQTVIERAKRGIYHPNRLSEVPRDILEEAFEKISGDMYTIKQRYKRLTSFYRKNLFELSREDFGSFDIIVSKNLFIYFDEEGKQKAMLKFHSLLRDGGILMLGNTDNPKATPGFSRVDEEMFLFEKI